jgi:hypothetical protein
MGAGLTEARLRSGSAKDAERPRCRAPSATISPKNWRTAPANPAVSPGSLSGAVVPQFKTVDIVPNTKLRSGASTATTAVQRHGPT